MNEPGTAPAGGSEVHVSLADYVSDANEAYKRDIVDCREVVARGAGLDYVAHLTAGNWDFSVQKADSELPSKDLDQACRQLGLMVARIDATADQLDSGPLIRVVVQGNGGALFYVLKVAGQNFFAATGNGARESVDRVDRELAGLADRAAGRVGAPSMLWGGYRKRGQTGDQRLFGVSKPTAEYPEPERRRGRKTVNEVTAGRCIRALDHNNIHFLAVYWRDAPLWRADLFDDTALAPLFQRATPSGRRNGYDKVLQQVMLQRGRLTGLLALVRSGRLTRLVLDVARGAIYILPLDNEHYLVGVTLLQDRVEEGDKKMTALHRELMATAFGPDRSSA